MRNYFKCDKCRKIPCVCAEPKSNPLPVRSESDGWDDKTCDHDFDNPKRIGRAHYECRKCGEDISLTLVMIEEASKRHPNSLVESERGTKR